jgi:hypothetical protein
MAHFAELETKVDPTGFTSDEQLIVKRVVVVGNDCVPSDMHIDGETWCINFFKGGTWKQTSYNSNFRKTYAGIGMVYDPVKDKFLTQQPYASWSLNADDNWKAPITFPTVLYFEHETDTYTQEDIDGDVYPEGHEQAGQRVNDYAVGDPLRIFYNISWNETKYNADNTKGWEAIKSNDTSETPTKYNWNGTAWVSE